MKEDNNMVLANGAQLPAKLDIDDAEFEGYSKVQPRMVWAQVRNKDLADDTGKIIQPRGMISFGDDRSDRGFVEGIVFIEAPGAVCFERGEVECKSNDRVSGSRISEERNENGRPVEVFGFCHSCFYCKHGGEKNRPKCRINRALGFLEVANDEIVDAFLMNLTPGSEKPWREYEGRCLSYIREATGQRDRDQVPWHRFLVRIGTEYVKDKRKGVAPYYVAKFDQLGIVKGNLLTEVLKQREALLEAFRQVRAAQEPSAEDYLGKNGNNKTEDEEVSFP